MHYIVFDLEFNQDFSSQNFDDAMAAPPKNFFEIIQIGAVKLDSGLQTIAVFNRFVKPAIFTKLNPFVAELTGITAEQLMSEEAFADVYKEFADFVQNNEAVFCVWGLTDIKELYKNTNYHKLDASLLPGSYINVQPYVSKHLKLSSKRQLRLETAVESLGLPKTYAFHNAFHDARYTAEVFKRIYNKSIVPALYDPSQVSLRTGRRNAKRVIDFEALLKQFEKMYSRELSEEEQGMIRLAYKMGRTNQFVKESNDADSV